MPKFSSNLLISILALFGTLLLSNISAAESPIYGPEWTFTNQELLNAHEYSEATKNEIYDRYFDKIDKHYAQFCASAVCKYDKDKRSLTFANEIVIEFTQDGGVIELKASPLSLADWKKHKDFIQINIFDALAKMNLKPHEIEGAGHLNVGLKYFETRTLLFRNFLVDFYNHSGLGTVLNSLEANKNDARYLADMMTSGEAPIMLAPKEFEKLQKKLTRIDVDPKSWNIDKYLKEVFSFAQTKWVALRVHKKFGFPSNWRFEIRTLRPQQNMQDFISAIEIFEASIKYLEKFTQPIALLPPKKVTDGWKVLGEFADYIDRTGLKWQNYRHLMPVMWRDLDDKNFIRGDNRPQMIQTPNACQMILL